MKILRRPNDSVHWSLSDPQSGDRKNPSKADKLNVMDINFLPTPISSKIGEEKPVIAEYENSIPMTMAHSLISSHLVFRLRINKRSKISV